MVDYLRWAAVRNSLFIINKMSFELSSLLQTATFNTTAEEFQHINKYFLPFHQRHRGSHQEKQSLCSGNHSDRCGWSSACN